MKPLIAMISIAVLSVLGSGCANAKLNQQNARLREDYAELMRTNIELRKDYAELVRTNDIELRKALDEMDTAWTEWRHSRDELAVRLSEEVPMVLLALSPETKARLHLHLLSVRRDGTHDVGKMAEADLAAGHVNIFTGGYSIFRPKEHQYLRTKYGMWILNVGSCTSGKAVSDMMSDYNSVVAKGLLKKFGKTLDEIFREAGAHAK